MEKIVLQQMVEEGLSGYEIARRTGKGRTTVRYWLKKYGLKTQHNQLGQRRWTDSALREAVESSVTKSDVLRKLGLGVYTGNYDTLDKHIARLQLDTSHFVGWAHGTGGNTPRSLAEVMAKNSTYSRTHLKNRLLRDGLLENSCALCGLGPEWQGRPLIMILDHINGAKNDHRMENLRLLCPNCNSQADTFCGRNKGKHD
jgi:hypothetical protein